MYVPDECVGFWLIRTEQLEWIYRKNGGALKKTEEYRKNRNDWENRRIYRQNGKKAGKNVYIQWSIQRADGYICQRTVQLMYDDFQKCIAKFWDQPALSAVLYNMDKHYKAVADPRLCPIEVNDETR